MRFVLVSALAIVAASFAAPIDAPVNDPADRYSGNGTSSIVFSTVIGGLGGTDFAGPSYIDMAALVQKSELPKISRISIRGDKRVDQISYDIDFPNGSVGNYKYGGMGGNPVSLYLQDGEFITEVRIQLGGVIQRRMMSELSEPSRPNFGQPAPILGDTAPILGDTAPILGDPAPILGDPAPILGDPAPILGDPAPIPVSNPALFGTRLQPPDGEFGVRTRLEDGEYGTRIVLTDGTPIWLSDAQLNGYLLSQRYIGIQMRALLDKIAIQQIYLIRGFVLGLALWVTNGIFGGLLIDHYIRKPHSLRLHYMAVITNLGEKIERGKQDDSSVMVIQPPPGYTKLVGFVGKSGDEVDAIGPVWG